MYSIPRMITGYNGGRTGQSSVVQTSKRFAGWPSAKRNGGTGYSRPNSSRGSYSANCYGNDPLHHVYYKYDNPADVCIDIDSPASPVNCEEKSQCPHPSPVPIPLEKETNSKSFWGEEGTQSRPIPVHLTKPKCPKFSILDLESGLGTPSGLKHGASDGFKPTASAHLDEWSDDECTKLCIDA